MSFHPEDSDSGDEKDVDMGARPPRKWGEIRNASGPRMPFGGLKPEPYVGDKPKWWADPPAVISNRDYHRYSEKDFNVDSPPILLDPLPRGDAYCLVSPVPKRLTVQTKAPVYRLLPAWWSKPPSRISAVTFLYFSRAKMKTPGRPAPYTFSVDRGTPDCEKGLLQAVLRTPTKPKPVFQPAYSLGIYPGCSMAVSLMTDRSPAAPFLPNMDRVIRRHLEEVTKEVKFSEEKLHIDEYMNQDARDTPVWLDSERRPDGTPCVMLHHDPNNWDILVHPRLPPEGRGPVYRPFIWALYKLNLMDEMKTSVFEDGEDGFLINARVNAWNGYNAAEREVLACQRLAGFAGPLGDFYDPDVTTDAYGSDSDATRHKPAN